MPTFNVRVKLPFQYDVEANGERGAYDKAAKLARKEIERWCEHGIPSLTFDDGNIILISK